MNQVEGRFRVSPTSDAINPTRQTVILKIGNFAARIQPGFFVEREDGIFSFSGSITGVDREVVKTELKIRPLGNNTFSFSTDGTGLNPTDFTKPVVVGLIIGSHTNRGGFVSNGYVR
jgi:hypothetical protein